MKINNTYTETHRTNFDGGLIDAHNELGKLVNQVGHWLYFMYDGHLGQRKIVHILSGVESMTQKDLQNILGVKPSSMSEIITKLEKKAILYEPEMNLTVAK